MKPCSLEVQLYCSQSLAIISLFISWNTCFSSYRISTKRKNLPLVNWFTSWNTYLSSYIISTARKELKFIKGETLQWQDTYVSQLHNLHKKGTTIHLGGNPTTGRSLNIGSNSSRCTSVSMVKLSLINNVKSTHPSIV